MCRYDRLPPYITFLASISSIFLVAVSGSTHDGYDQYAFGIRAKIRSFPHNCRTIFRSSCSQRTRQFNKSISAWQDRRFGYSSVNGSSLTKTHGYPNRLLNRSSTSLIADLAGCNSEFLPINAQTLLLRLPDKHNQGSLLEFAFVARPHVPTLFRPGQDINLLSRLVNENTCLWMTVGLCGRGALSEDEPEADEEEDKD